MKKIVLTGGGTAGHVTPNIALIRELKKAGWEISYIGTETGIEHELIAREGIPYYSVRSGKLRRYLSKENIKDAFRVIAGISDAKKVLKQIKPDVIFSKGGFVAVPVVIAGGRLGIPVVIHESDITPGLANKLSMPHAKTVCTTFPETLKYIKGGKGVYTGSPIRKELFESNRAQGLNMCGFTADKPVILSMGGSLGAVKINNALRKALPSLLRDFQVVHLCGKGNVDESLTNMKGYKQFEYVNEELKNIFAAADVIISRSGSNSISEFLALKKPSLLIPLSTNASRGDQILNADSFNKQGFSKVLKEENIDNIEAEIRDLYKNRSKYIKAMDESNTANGVDRIINEINKAADIKKAGK
ncbi:MAG: undecaprenyldiphospho-muramoylpentapeptide beta-N-acetylglucosaminyltransferase [Candidatus Metalachnospira sp.]|nr:undecaprenyldiphospho-muramoylpentapeptide beta-N-acetylglucosaminyltransferase [Candidatus Metalachnospira sp.]